MTSIRGIAAWWVVLYHFREAWPATYPEIAARVMGQGYLAVDLFFILSGFVMALNYGQVFRDGMQGSLRFYALRLARIYPLHLVMMLLFLANPLAIALFSRQGLSGEGYDAAYYGLSLLLIQNWGFTSQLDWNIPAWSISTEWFAYLCFPALVLALRRWPGGVAGRIGLLVLLLAALAAVGQASGGLGGRIEQFGILRCLFGFCLGMTLHGIVAAWPARPAWVATVALLVTAGCCWLYAAGLAADYLVMPLGFLALILALLDARNGLARMLRWRVLEWLGTVSYSTYLSHYFIKTWVKFLLVQEGPVGILPMAAYVAATLLASAVLYYGVELPGQRRLRGVVARWTALPGAAPRGAVRQDGGLNG